MQDDDNSYDNNWAKGAEEGCGSRWEKLEKCLFIATNQLTAHSLQRAEMNTQRWYMLYVLLIMCEIHTTTIRFKIFLCHIFVAKGEKKRRDEPNEKQIQMQR
jgi:hypothetical protein